MPTSSILETIGNTPLVELKRLQPKPGVRLFAKLEGQNPTGSVKDRIAMHMVEAAEADGILGDGRIILEPSSGNTGVSLAMVGRYKGYDITIVLPDNVTEERQILIESYGAKVVFSDGRLGTNGAIEAAQEMAANEPDRYVMLFQYGNEANPRAHYEGTGEEIIKDLPEVDTFVAGLGTGGTLTGVGRRLKDHNPDTASSPSCRTRKSASRAFVHWRTGSSRRSWIHRCLTANSSSRRVSPLKKRESCSMWRASLPASHRAPYLPARCAWRSGWKAGTSSAFSPMVAGNTFRRDCGRARWMRSTRRWAARSGGSA